VLLSIAITTLSHHDKKNLDRYHCRYTYKYEYMYLSIANSILEIVEFLIIRFLAAFNLCVVHVGVHVMFH